jgi:hypothetical protein
MSAAVQMEFIPDIRVVGERNFHCYVLVLWSFHNLPYHCHTQIRILPIFHND